MEIQEHDRGHSSLEDRHVPQRDDQGDQVLVVERVLLHERLHRRPCLPQRRAEEREIALQVGLL